MEQTKPTNIVRVYRPELTAQEREQRMSAIKAAAVQVLAASFKRGAKSGPTGVHR